MSQSVFLFDDYRAFLRAQITSQERPWGLITSMAKAANCRRPYLSKVLRGAATLSQPQAHGVAQFWKLSGFETDYFLLMVEAERTASGPYKQFLEVKLAALRKRHEDLSGKVQRTKHAVESGFSDYYSAWHWSAIHIATSIPALQTVEAIGERLALSPAIVESVLDRLAERGYVQWNGRSWSFLAFDQHVARESMYSVFHHANWRNRAILDSQDPNRDSVHYTVVQSLSRQDYQRIKQEVLNLIQKTAEIARPSKEEDLMCLSCDLFIP